MFQKFSNILPLFCEKNLRLTSYGLLGTVPSSLGGHLDVGIPFIDKDRTTTLAWDKLQCWYILKKEIEMLLYNRYIFHKPAMYQIKVELYKMKH